MVAVVYVFLLFLAYLR